VRSNYPKRDPSAFSRWDYYGGISAGLDAVIKATKGEYKAEGRTRNNVTNLGSVLLSVILFVIFGISIFGGGRRYGISSRGHYQSGYWGGGFGGGGFGGGGGGGWSGAADPLAVAERAEAGK